MKGLKKTYQSKVTLFLVVVFIIGTGFFPIHNALAEALVPCGRTGQPMCTLCDLIKGIYDIVQYIIKIAVWVTLTAIAIGGGMYALSAGNSNMIELAKGAMKKALIGLVIVLTAWLMVNTLLLVIGTQSNLGITGVVSWGKFECAATN